MSYHEDTSFDAGSRSRGAAVRARPAGAASVDESIESEADQ
jgi:hypothetical protein